MTRLQKKNPETIIQNQVREALRMDGWYVIRHQQGQDLCFQVRHSSSMEAHTSCVGAWRISSHS